LLLIFKKEVVNICHANMHQKNNKKGGQFIQ
jgi:hypothetical protein